MCKYDIFRKKRLLWSLNSRGKAESNYLLLCLYTARCRLLYSQSILTVMRKNSHRTSEQEYNYPDNSQKLCFVNFANHMPPVSNFKFNFYNKQFFQIPLLHTILLHNNTIKQIIQLPIAWHSHY